MQTIRVVVSVVSPTHDHEVDVTLASQTTLEALLELLLSEHALSRDLLWEFDLTEEEKALTIGDLAARAGTARLLRLALLGRDPSADGDPELEGSDFDLAVEDSGADFELPAPPVPAPSLPPKVAATPLQLPGAAPPAPQAPASAPERPASPPGSASGDSDSKSSPPGDSPEVVLLDEEAPARSRAKRKSSARREDDYDTAAVPPRRTSRRATVRYYTRMNPDRMFPLLVVLSKEEIAEVVKAKVKQAQSEAFQVDEGSVVEVEPVLPGCDCYPPRSALTVDADGATSATIWVVPKVLGRIQGARVVIRQGAKVLAEVPLDVKVAKQTLAVACGLLSLAAPYLTMGLKSLKLDYASQKEEGFPLYQRAGSWVAENLRPEWLGLGFLGLAFLLYLWMRPRRRDVFWDVQGKS